MRMLLFYGVKKGVIVRGLLKIMSDILYFDPLADILLPPELLFLSPPHEQTIRHVQMTFKRTVAPLRTETSSGRTQRDNF